MNVVITGGAGFLGSRLARELLAAGSVELAGAAARPLSRVTLIDQAPVPPDLSADQRVAAIRGSLGELLASGDQDHLQDKPAQIACVWLCTTVQTACKEHGYGMCWCMSGDRVEGLLAAWPGRVIPERAAAPPLPDTAFRLFHIKVTSSLPVVCI